MTSQTTIYSTIDEFARHVWDTLAVIDVDPISDKKGNLDFVNWAQALTDVWRIFPRTEPIRLPDEWLENGTANVWTQITIAQGEFSLSRKMWLPVMDNRNNSIADPSSRHMSDAAVRCWVKNLAMFGYGMKHWRKTVLADAGDFTASIDAEEVAQLVHLIDESGSDMARFLKAAQADSLEDIKANRFATLKDMLERKLK